MSDRTAVPRRTTLAAALVALPLLYAAQLAIGTLTLPIAAAQSVGVLAVFLALRDRVPSRAEVAAIVLASLAMVAMALAAPTHGDAWAYVGYAILPGLTDAYHPPSVPFTGDFATVNRFIGTPMVPCVYGPFWLLYDRLLVHWVPTLAIGVTVLKLAGALTVLAVFAALRRLALPPAVLAAAALDPALIHDGVWGAHNDFFALLLALAAMLALGHRQTVLAVALTAAAILVKITFVVVALIVFADGSRRYRMVAFATTLLLSAAVMAVVGGRDLLHAMTVVAAKATNDPGRFVYLHVATALLAAVLAAATFAGGRAYAGLAWAFGMLSSALYSWYLAWGVPYVARARAGDGIALFAVWPLMLALKDGGGRPLTPFVLVLALLTVAALRAMRAAPSRIVSARA